MPSPKTAWIVFHHKLAVADSINDHAQGVAYLPLIWLSEHQICDCRFVTMVTDHWQVGAQ